MKSPENTIAAPVWTAGEEHLGFRVAEVVPLPYLRGAYYALEHIATGARYIHIQCPDRENAFGVAFKTVPADATGVAHILEHTVLCGSQKFPVRDPFFSMLKRSLSTFMNAFTASDWTLYPFATQNRKDFYNLLDVYLDAAFFPRLERMSFKQEGHRLEFEGDDAGGNRQLVYKGVVYNEMKGAMSSPDQVLGRSLLHALYPDTTYRFNSGGDPQVIPELTVEGLRAFHKRHYHPSNAFFYSYGNLPLEDHLTFISRKVLKGFSRIDPQTEVPSQPRWQAPREAVYPYPLAPDEDPTRKCQIGIGWLTSDIRDVYEVLVLTLLEQILMGNPASPLRKALLESGMGSSLADGTGFDADNRDTMFFCGLKDVAESDGEKIADLIMDTLGQLADEGIDPDLIESAIHQVEFHRREITNTPYPYGLKLLVALTGTWIHGGQPHRMLLFEDDIAELRRQMATPGFFEERLRRHFIDNPHHIFFKLVPDQQLANEQLRTEADKLKQIQADLAPAAAAQIEADAEALKRLQEEEENVALLPTLAIGDIPPEVTRVAAPAMPNKRIRIYAQPTAGIFYFSAALDIESITPETLPLAPLFCYAAARMGTADKNYVELARYLDRYTGGLGLAVQARRRFDEEGQTLPMVTIGGKCLDRNRDRLFEVLGELVHRIPFDDLEQLKRVVKEFRAMQEAAVVHHGHRLAISLASRHMTPSAHLNEIWHGIHQLQWIKALDRSMATDATALETVSAQLATIARSMFHRRNIQMALISSRMPLEDGLQQATALNDRLPFDPAIGHRRLVIHPEATTVWEGWHTGSAVSFVAQTLPCIRYPHSDAPALAVTAKLLRSLYLHREIREKGGAYGGFALYNPEEGLFSFGSYRDPHIRRTMDVYDGVAAFIAAGEYTQDDIREAILQVCSDIDKPDPPGPAARKAFYRQLVGLDDEQRQQFKERLLSLDRDTVRSAAERHLGRLADRTATAVISSREKLESANRAMPDRPLELNAI
jgi:Zn-dependent M16 (insulinase) family peptidase